MIITIITIETTMATTTIMIIINKSKTLTNIMTIIHGDKDIYMYKRLFQVLSHIDISQTLAC